MAQILISTDCHCGAGLLEYKPYLERRYHDDFDRWASEFHDPWAEEVDLHRDPNQRAGNASMVAPLNWDSDLRLDYLDSQGIAAEVLFPNTAPPFFPSGVLAAPGPRTPEELELRSAGLRAHNRWLADFCSQAPDRRAGLAQIFLDDIESAVDEVRWAKQAGLRGVLVPNDHVLRMSNLYYPEYDPLWAVCAELQMPVHRHAAFPTESIHEGGKASELVAFFEVQFYTLRAIGHMILSGVFERHPDLLYVTTEISAASEVVPYLARMDAVSKMGLAAGTPLYEHITEAVRDLHSTASEYFAEHCYLGGPANDLRLAHDLGAPNLMWGADIPHSEGSAPYTIEMLRAMLCDLPDDDLEALLCTRAARVYGFDLDRLQPLADRIGPTLAQIHQPLPAEERPRYPEDTCCPYFMDNHAEIFEPSLAQA